MISSTLTSPKLQQRRSMVRRRASAHTKPSISTIQEEKSNHKNEATLFTAIPLTPHLSGSNTTSNNTLKRLPTPDFEKPLPSPGSPSTGYEWASVKLVSGTSSSNSSSSVRTISRTQSSKNTDRKERTIRKSLLTFRDVLSSPKLNLYLASNDKFTRKWPSFRSSTRFKLVRKRRGLLGTVQEELLEDDGLGLGFDSAMEQWTSFKWCLLFSVLSLFAYGSLCLLTALMVWFRAFAYSDVVTVIDNDILILTTLASSIILLAFVTGLTGTLLNSRPILSIYALLLWPAFFSMMAVGYVSYKRYAFSLDRKLDHYWSQYFTPLGRLLIQDALHCCGYFNALHEATPSARCYSRTIFPGCKAKLLRFERQNLRTIWKLAFGLAPLHLINIGISLLCANHVTQPFGMRIPPKKYWLSGEDVRNEAEKFLGRNGMADDLGDGRSWCTRPQMMKVGSSMNCREDREKRG